MRSAAFALVLAVVAVASGAAQKEPQAPRDPKKGDNVVVKGCLTGQSLAATDLGTGGQSGALASGVTFRLTGDKQLLKQLRDGHDGKVVEVAGVLKSDLPKESVATRKVGGMRITIGTPAATPGSHEAESRRSLPVLDVKSFDGTTVGCGR